MIKLFNKGTLEIHFKGGILYPQKAVEVTAETAASLRKLYPETVIDMETMVSGFNDADTTKQVEVEKGQVTEDEFEAGFEEDQDEGDDKPKRGRPSKK